MPLHSTHSLPLNAMSVDVKYNNITNRAQAPNELKAKTKVSMQCNTMLRHPSRACHASS